MKRLHIKIKHKLAWHFRKWADKLEPEVRAPFIQKPFEFEGREYKLRTLRLRVDMACAWGNPEVMQYEYDRAVRQIGVAASTKVEPKQVGRNLVEFQLLILEPKDNEN